MNHSLIKYTQKLTAVSKRIDFDRYNISYTWHGLLHVLQGDDTVL